MLAGYINDLKFWLKNHPNKFYRNVFLILKKTRSLEIPTPQVVNISFYFLYKFISNLINTTARIALYTPAFKGRLSHYGKHLFLYGGLPYVSGPLRITVGDNCRISGQTTLSGRTHSTPRPSLLDLMSTSAGKQPLRSAKKSLLKTMYESREELFYLATQVTHLMRIEEP